MAELGKNIDKAAQILRQGGLVAIPTETVYGLAANALNEKALLKVFEAKQRPFFDPLILHVDTIESAKKYAQLNDERLLVLANKLWPGPLTLLLPKKELVPDLATSGLPQVAIRVPKHPLTLQLLQRIPFPLAAPSANPFGYISPTEPAHVNKQLGDKLDYILDGGACKVGIESTIVGLEEGRICVYRLGGCAIEEIEKMVGKVSVALNQSNNPKVPGQLKSHYAPKKPMLFGNLSEHIKIHASKKLAVLCFGYNVDLKKINLVFNLSESKDFKEAAINLFKFLRLADESDADLILCEQLPDVDLGRAINDRMRRAAAQ